MDRGRRNYTKFINKLAKQLNIQERTITAHDLHLPTCLKSTIGTVTINSTVGISSLYHQAPTITLGNAVYDIEHLTCKNMPLDKFWTEYKKPDQNLFKKFRLYLIENTQLNGNFYGKIPDEL
jgi:capsular polysaccharide export protein